jgi:hypothetical protein
MKNLEMVMELATMEAKKKETELRKQAKELRARASQAQRTANELIEDAEDMLVEAFKLEEQALEVETDIKEGTEAMAELKEKTKDNPLVGLLAEALIFGGLK